MRIIVTFHRKNQSEIVIITIIIVVGVITITTIQLVGLGEEVVITIPLMHLIIVQELAAVGVVGV